MSTNNSMFSQGEDLPLFSGTCVRVVPPTRAHTDIIAVQDKFVECAICFDTGVVHVKGKDRRCWCKRGHPTFKKQVALDRDAGRDLIAQAVNAVPGFANTDPVDMPDDIFEAWIGCLTQDTDAQRTTVEAWRQKRRDHQSRQTLKQLPKSKRLTRVQRNAPNAYDEARGDGDTEKVLREAAAVQTVTDRFGQVGATGLSTIELLTLLIGDKTPTTAARIIAQFQTLARVHHAAVSQLALVPGMTRRRAVLLQSALELAARRDAATEPPTIKCPSDLVAVVGPAMRGLDHEEMWVVSLSTKNRILDSSTVYRGSVHTTVIRVGELFRPALFTNASAVIVLHNHPSGDPTPSPEDVAVTREIASAAKLLDIDLLDHLVIGDPGFVSLKERGLGFG